MGSARSVCVYVCPLLTISCRLPHLWPGKTSNCFSRLGHKSHRPWRKDRVTFVKMFNGGGQKTRRRKRSLSTFGVVSGVKLKKLNGVVGKTVHVDPVLQHDDDPDGKKMCGGLSVTLSTQLHIGQAGDSLVGPHADSQDGFREGELQHQLVFGVARFSGVVPDKH